MQLSGEKKQEIPSLADDEAALLAASKEKNRPVLILDLTKDVREAKKKFPPKLDRKKTLVDICRMHLYISNYDNQTTKEVSKELGKPRTETLEQQEESLAVLIRKMHAENQKKHDTPMCKQIIDRVEAGFHQEGFLRQTETAFNEHISKAGYVLLDDSDDRETSIKLKIIDKYTIEIEEECLFFSLTELEDPNAPKTVSEPTTDGSPRTPLFHVKNKILLQYDTEKNEIVTENLSSTVIVNLPEKGRLASLVSTLQQYPNDPRKWHKFPELEEKKSTRKKSKQLEAPIETPEGNKEYKSNHNDMREDKDYGLFDGDHYIDYQRYEKDDDHDNDDDDDENAEQYPFEQIPPSKITKTLLHPQQAFRKYQRNTEASYYNPYRDEEIEEEEELDHVVIIAANPTITASKQNAWLIKNIQAIASPLRSIFAAGLFAMLGFTVFASSVDFGLAMPNGFLMQGVLGTPLIVLILAALAVAFISHLVMRSLKSAVADIPTCQAITSAPEAEKILQGYSDVISSEAQISFDKALLIHIEHAKKLLSTPWKNGLVYYGALNSLAATTVNTDFGHLCNIQNALNQQKKLDPQQKKTLTDIFTRIKNATIDPHYRANSTPLSQGLWSILFTAISATLLVGCTVTLIYIFTAGATLPIFLGMNGMMWSMALAAILGVASWLSAKHILNKNSGGPYATLAAVFGAGVFIFGTLWVFLSINVGIGLSLPVVAAVTGSLACLFIAFTALAVKNAIRSPTERTRKLTSLKNRRTWLKILLVVGLPTTLVTCVVLVFFILTGVLGPLFLAPAILAGFACLGLSDYTISRISNSPFATATAISVISLFTITLVWPLSGAGLSMAFLGVTLGLVGLLTVSTVLLFRDKHKTTQRAGQDGERPLRALKIVLIIGFLFLAFLSMALIFQLGNLGQLDGMLGHAFDIIAEKLGYGGFEIGAQWMSAFFVGIFATSSFIAFELLKSVLQKAPASNIETELDRQIAQLDQQASEAETRLHEFEEQGNGFTTRLHSLEQQLTALSSKEISVNEQEFETTIKRDAKHGKLFAPTSISVQKNTLIDKIVELEEKTRLITLRQQQQELTTIGPALLKLIFTLGLIIFLTAMPSTFVVSGAITSMLPIFLLVAGLMPMFSGNANLPYFKVFKDFNRWFNTNFFWVGLGVKPLFGKNSALQYLFREFLVIAILYVIPLILFAAGVLDTMSIAVLGVGIGATTIFRVSSMLWNKMNPNVLAQVYLEQSTEDNRKLLAEGEYMPVKQTEDDVQFLADEKNDTFENSQKLPSAEYIPVRETLFTPELTTFWDTSPKQQEAEDKKEHSVVVIPKITNNGRLLTTSLFGVDGPLYTAEPPVSSLSGVRLPDEEVYGQSVIPEDL